MLKIKRLLCSVILLFMPFHLSATEASQADGSLLFINKTNFRFYEDIGFYVPKLATRLIPDEPTGAVVFDKPKSFSITPLQGEVVLSGSALEALLNKYVFTYKNAPLRMITAETHDDSFILGGQMDRNGVWVPFKMIGNLILSKGHILKFTPWTVIVDGENAGKVLKAANVTLDELLTVHAKGADLIGSTIVLNTRLLFPPPKLNLNIATAKVEERGLVLTFNEPENPDFPTSMVSANSSMIVTGGKVKFLNTTAEGTVAEFVSLTEGKEFDFNLYRYVDQLVPGYLNMRADGSIIGYLKNYNEIESAGAGQ